MLNDALFSGPGRKKAMERVASLLGIVFARNGTVVDWVFVTWKL